MAVTDRSDTPLPHSGAERTEGRQREVQPTDAASSAAVGAQDDARAKREKIERLVTGDDRTYDSTVGDAVAAKLNGKGGRDKQAHEVEGENGRHFPSTTHAAVPELDGNGKPTGKMIQLDKLTNGELANLLHKTIAEYDKPGNRDGGAAYQAALQQSRVPEEQKAFGEAMSEAAQSLRIGQPGGLTEKDLNRLLRIQGDFSAEDKRLLEGIGGAQAVESFGKARDAFQKYDTDLRELNQKLAREGVFFEGKGKLCCCVNARNKAAAMIFRARTGNPPEGASCVGGHLESVM